MSALNYKQLTQVRNALRRSLSSPGQFLVLLITLIYGALTIAMVLAIALLPLPELTGMLAARSGGVESLGARIAALRGALVGVLLLLSSTAAFQNPLVQFTSADIDLLFSTPVPAWRALAGKLLLNHLRTLFAGFFFWGLAVVPALRLLGYDPAPMGLWAVTGLALLFASVDQGLAYLQIMLGRPEREGSGGAGLWLARGAVLLFGAAMILVLAGVVARLASGSWGLLSGILATLGGPLLSSVLLPVGWVADLMFLPAFQQPGAALLPYLGLLLIDVATALLLMRLIAREGSGLLLETALSPVGQARLSRLLRRVGLNPLRLAVALWKGQSADDEAGGSVRRSAVPGPRLGRLVYDARTHIWRRLVEMGRTPLRNLMALLALAFIPLAIYNPAEGYALGRLVSVIIFSISLSSQLFNDAAEHLRYAGLELSLPVPRWRALIAAHLPRLVLYWIAGLLLIGSAGLFSKGTRWDDLVMIALWYPLVLAPPLALRSVLVFLFPAAGIPGQRDPLLAVVVTFINGLMVIVVLFVSLVPFGVVSLLIQLLGINRLWLWSVVLSTSMLTTLITVAMACWAYGRFEPGES